MRCARCVSSSWRVMYSSPHGLNQASTSAAVSLTPLRGASSSASLPPIRKHKRHVTRLEHAAAIGLQALQQQAQQASAAEGPAAAAVPSRPVMPPAVQQLLQQQRPQKKRVGALQKLPVIPPAEEIAASAAKRSRKVQPAAGIKNEAEKERSRAAKQLDTHMKELSVPLTRFLKGFPALSSLHPFELALLELTVGEAMYTSVLQKVDALRKSIQETGKGYAARASNAANKKAATAVAEEGAEALAAVFAKGSKAIEDLKKVSRSLRSLPYVDPALPTLALIGAPNVGKSSLVRVLSSGVPEVCNYPFTTRSIKMGHFYIDAKRHQITDTPGLLPRPDDYRNKMEMLTLAALQHLPSSVMFVADLTEECGTSVADQWLIRQELKGRFASKPWIDVLSKADLLQDVWQQADLEQQQQEDDSSSSSSSNVQDAVQYAAAIRDAVRVSSVTEEGLQQLQQGLVELLQSPEAAAEEAAGAAMMAEVASSSSSNGAGQVQ